LLSFKHSYRSFGISFWKIELSFLINWLLEINHGTYLFLQAIISDLMLSFILNFIDGGCLAVVENLKFEINFFIIIRVVINVIKE